MANICMLGTGFIGRFYTESIQGQRSRDRVAMIYSRQEASAKQFMADYSIPHWSTDMEAAIQHPDTQIVVVALPNHLHEAAVMAAVAARKPVLCTKPLGRNPAEALRMMQACEAAGVFGGYLEDLVYTPKFLKALESVQNGAIGRVLWAKSRETHPGPHSDWFWNKELSGGGALLDMGCHCIEIGRSYIGKDIRPVEVMCWADTQVKPIDAEDHAIGLVKYENGAIGQLEVSWTFRGGLDLRDEVMGSEGTIWTNSFLRTGFDLFTSGKAGAYVAEKSEASSGWLFPVGDEHNELGYNHMFTDMFNAIEQGTAPRETFYDGYVVNAIMDACYKSVDSKKWEPVELAVWRGRVNVPKESGYQSYDDKHWLVKEEVMPGGEVKVILKEKDSGKIIQVLR